MAANLDNLPELIVISGQDGAQAKRIRRLAAAGKLRRLYTGVYTSNLAANPEAIVGSPGGAALRPLAFGDFLSTVCHVQSQRRLSRCVGRFQYCHDTAVARSATAIC